METPVRTRLTIAAFGLLAATLAGAAPASAHAILVDSTPVIGGSVPAGMVAIRLRFNSRIDIERSRLTLTRPDATKTVLPIAQDVTDDVLATSATLTAGAYSIRWQVLAVDGHITRGDIRFTVGPPQIAPLNAAAK